MIHVDPAFGHDLLQITIRNRISNIEEHGVQDDGFGIVAAFEVNRHVLILTRQFKMRRLSQVCTLAHILKLCDRTQNRPMPVLRRTGQFRTATSLKRTLNQLS